MNSVLIVAAGSGKRMGSNIPKQFLPLCGRPVLSYTIEAFENSPCIDEIIIVTNEDNVGYVKDEIAAGFKKVKSVVKGGSERQYSVYNGLCAVSENCKTVLIHDGVRPFISGECIKNIIEETEKHGCCILAVPVKDTIKISDKDGFIESTPDRAMLWQAQTPQAFKYDIIIKAHKKALDDGFLGTDDAMLTEREGYRTKLVMGSYENIKLTTPEDMRFGEEILNNMKER